jgi:UDP-2,3-diacylglucosamine pyrophosphatase LpxH
MARTPRSVFISDTHLGAREAQSEALLAFLKEVDCEYLYLVGDILDLWKVRAGWHWPQINTNIVQLVMDKAANGTRVIYIPGNHDETFRDYVGAHLGGIEVQLNAVHETADERRLLVLHGDELDAVVRSSRWIAVVGSHAYLFLLRLNRWFNWARRRLGFPYWSLAGFLKHRVKNAMQYISQFEEALAQEAHRRHADGVVCGHIHRPALTTMDGGVLYANCGDWVESCTALVENGDGQLCIVDWLEQYSDTPGEGEEISRCA